MELRPLDPVPSLDEVFGANGQLYALLNKHFDDLAPILMLTPQGLLDTDGVGPKSVRHVTTALAAHGLRQREFSEKPRSYIERLFGKIESAPLSVLQLDTHSVNEVWFSEHKRLRVISQLIQLGDFSTISSLTALTRAQLCQLLKTDYAYEDDSVKKRLQEIDRRLSIWNLDFSTEERQTHLHAVS